MCIRDRSQRVVTGPVGQQHLVSGTPMVMIGSPAQLGVTPLGMAHVMPTPYGAATMDSMGMIHHHPLAAGYGAQQHQQYVQAYGGHSASGMMDASGGQGQPRAGGSPMWAQEQMAGPSQVYGSMGDRSPELGAAHAAFGGIPIPGAVASQPQSLSGSFPTGMGGMMGDRQSNGSLSSSVANSSDESPPGASWDRLYVSNLPKNYAEADVRRLFAQYGNLTLSLIHI